MTSVTSVPSPPMATVKARSFNLADLFEIVAEAVPQRPALLCGPLRLTFAALEDRANRVSALLEEHRVVPGSRVALALGNGHHFLQAMLGTLKLRATPVSINRQFVKDEIRALLEDAAADVVICEPGLAAEVRAAAGPDTAMFVADDQFDTLLRNVTLGPASQPPVLRSGEDSYLLYTGGTTGLPKAVIWRHEDLFFGALGGGRAGEPISKPEDILAGIDPSPSRTLIASPLTHGMAQWAALVVMFGGGTIILCPDAFDAELMLDVAAAERVSRVVLVGNAFAATLAEALERHPNRWDLEDLVVIASGGATLSTTLASRLLDHLPGAVVVDGYGASETGMLGRRVIVPGHAAQGAETFRLSPGTVVLGDDLRPLAADSGEVGRVAHRGYLPLGYPNDPAATRETFLGIDGEQWALTGDLARVEANNSITLLGRVGRLINSGGEKVYALEVEAIVATHPAVNDAMVIGLADHRFGEVVTALVTLRGEETLSLQDLRTHCQKSVAAFKAPRRLLVVDALPRTANGKADIAAAARLFSVGQPTRSP